MQVIVVMMIIMVSMKIQWGQIIGLLELRAMPHLLSLQGYGGYSGYHVIMVIKQKDGTCGQII